jgi:protoporphyrinogen oxidase
VVFSLLEKIFPVKKAPSDIPKTAAIIGAGPAGLTAALELLEQTDIIPVIYEMSEDIGGIARTVRFKGNAMDIGGHRYFTKDAGIEQWWLEKLPLQGKPAHDDRILGRQWPLSSEPEAPDPEQSDRVMLIRRRLSRMYFLHRFIDYPLKLSIALLRAMGLARFCAVSLSYCYRRILPKTPEKSLEEFFINRFGDRLYRLFFRDYSHKVWGVPCSSIRAEWGAQRIEGLTGGRAVLKALRGRLVAGKNRAKENLPTLTDWFYYPKNGAGQMWEEVAEQIRAKGGEIHLKSEVVGLTIKNGRVNEVIVNSGRRKGEKVRRRTDYCLSTMPVQDLIHRITPVPPEEVGRVASGLEYRDFITVGILLSRMKLKNTTDIPTINNIIPDTWLYIQDNGLRLGRIQIYNNWSPYLVADPANVWLGLEYFCSQGDELWQKSDIQIASLAIDELVQIGLAEDSDVLDTTVIRVEKAYPGYFGSYDDFHLIKNYADSLENLFLIGRNGMHRYNNMDHSMLTAMAAVANIRNGTSTKENIWAAGA